MGSGDQDREELCKIFDLRKTWKNLTFGMRRFSSGYFQDYQGVTNPCRMHRLSEDGE
jgi:hypothetical protein